LNARVDQVEPCGSCQPMHEIDCEACGGSGVERHAPPPPADEPNPLFWPDPDWCPACGGCGSSWVPAHPIGEAHA
jgi:hypothetical protein